jgi:hypothetical protein
MVPPDLPAAKIGVSGRLLIPYEEDRYRIPVAAGSKLKLEVSAERLGSPLDAALVVRNEAGDVLARAEDGPGTTDPFLEYAVPEKVSAVIVGVIDALGRGGPHGVYRLTIDPQLPAATNPEYRLITSATRLQLPIGGHCVFPVWIERRGDSGAVELASTSLPAGIKLDGASIPEGVEGTLVTVHRGESFREPALTTWHGRGADGWERAVSIAGHPFERLQPWLASEIVLAPLAAQAAEFQIDWPGLASDAGLVPAGKLALPVKLVRPAGDAFVRLTLMTSQPPTLVNGQPDPNRALRQEKPIELAANVNEGEVALLLPPDLPAPFYDVTVQAESLKSDKRTVLATACTPVRRLPVRMSVVVQLAGATRVETQIDPQKGATVVLSGKVERREGLTGEVVLGVTGLPAGARADAIAVKADATEFLVNLVLPATFPVGEYQGLKLSGSVTPDPNQPNLRVKSRDVELTLVVKAPPAK